MSHIKWNCVCILVLGLFQFAATYKYLIVLPTAGQSHYNVGFSLAKGLAAAGHQVTVVSRKPLKNPIKNIENVPIESMQQDAESENGNFFEVTKMSIIEQTKFLIAMGLNQTEVFLTDQAMVNLMASNRTYDAVICDVFLTEALFGLAEHFNAPFIGLSCFGAASWNTDLVGSPSPPSYVPNLMAPFTDHMTLLQRIGNFLFYIIDFIHNEFIYMPEQEKLYMKYFPNNKQDFYDMRRNTALVLLNSHVSLSYPRPYSPNMIEVGGMHINRKRQPLPTDVEEFINGAEHGVVYFSLGSNFKSKHVPLDKRNEIIRALGNLKQRVLWKFENTELPGKPDNVFIRQWFSQDDILAHKNVIAFVTHGGLLSTTESIYHGTPFIGIPIGGDQFLNMAKAEANGYGVIVNFNELSAVKLQSAIEGLINDPEATKRIQQMSERYRDQQNLPIERAVYWVEHVTRHQGARYLRSASQDLNFIQYHSLDVIFVLFSGLVAIFVVIVLLIHRISRLLCRLFFGRRQLTGEKLKRK